MDRSISAIEVQPVKWRVADDPIGDLRHVFMFDVEIAGRPATIADQLLCRREFERRMLIKFRSYSSADVLAKLMRAEAIGQPDGAEVVNDGIY